MHKTSIFPCEYHPLLFPQKLLCGVLCAQREPLLTSVSPSAHLALVPFLTAPHPMVLSRASHKRSTGEQRLSTSWTHTSLQVVTTALISVWPHRPLHPRLPLSAASQVGPLGTGPGTCDFLGTFSPRAVFSAPHAWTMIQR